MTDMLTFYLYLYTHIRLPSRQAYATHPTDQSNTQALVFRYPTVCGAVLSRRLQQSYIVIWPVILGSSACCCGRPSVLPDPHTSWSRALINIASFGSTDITTSCHQYRVNTFPGQFALRSPTSATPLACRQLTDPASAEDIRCRNSLKRCGLHMAFPGAWLLCCCW